jgi:hypothetical protein
VKTRDLVAVRAPDRDSLGSGSGIVISVDRDFYSHVAGQRMNRVHVMWSNGTITYEPESWLCKLEEKEETE